MDMKQNKVIQKLFALCLTLLLVLPLLPCGAMAAGSGGEIDLSQKGVRIGVGTGTAQEKLVNELFPDSEIFYYHHLDGYAALAQGKLDAFVFDKKQMELAIQSGLRGVRLLDGSIGEPTKIAIGISNVSEIPDLENRVNSFVQELKRNGTLDDMYDRWVVREDFSMPEIEGPDVLQTHLTVGTTGIAPPYTFYEGTELTGYDIELMYRLAAWLGADVTFEVYDYSGVVQAAQIGKVDVVAANLQVTPERAEALTFSETLYEEETGVMVRDTASSAPALTQGGVRWQDYNGKRIGILVGPLMEDAAAEVFPDSEYLLFNSYPDCAAALLAGKIDGFLIDEPGVISMHAETPEIDYIHESLTENNYAFAFRKDDPESARLCAELDEFLARSWADGTMEEIAAIWLGVDDSRKVVDISDLTGENGTVKVVTTSTDMPWSYIKDGKNVGYDIDLVVRFCRDKGYALELGDVDFAGRIPAVQSGKYDFTTDMNVTPEREEQVLFSSPTAHGGIVLAVLSADLEPSGDAAESESELRGFADLNGKTVSMLTGAPFEELVRAKAPDVGAFTFFNNTPDMLLALEDGKTDAVLINNAIAVLAVNRNQSLALFPQNLQDGAFGLAFAKGGAERDKWQVAYDTISEEEKQALWEKWTGSDESVKILPEQNWPGLNGTVRAAVCDTLEPMSYAGEGGELMGFDVEMILRIAKELDVHVEFTGMEFAAVLATVQAGKADVGGGSIIITAERREAVDFVEYYPAAFVLIVRAAQADEAAEDAGFFSSVRSSFEKTFLRESRWKLFLEGIGTTLLITVLSILFGTALGFGAYMLCRNGNPAANALTRFFVWLVQGMPVVVLLMILYYIIFAKSSVSGTTISVVGFTLVFGAAMYGMLRTGVGAIPKGQTEAAYALGYGNAQTFFRIILPQAVPHFLPSYKGQITALIKATAVVGYIAVQDLTKMGDIVRGRTYEAFFPLIAVAVIYFILAAALTYLVNRLEILINPRRRRKEDILKGVKADD